MCGLLRHRLDGISSERRVFVANHLSRFIICRIISCYRLIQAGKDIIWRLVVPAAFVRPCLSSAIQQVPTKCHKDAAPP
jgi:hypothetical protein